MKTALGVSPSIPAMGVVPGVTECRRRPATRSRRSLGALRGTMPDDVHASVDLVVGEN